MKRSTFTNFDGTKWERVSVVVARRLYEEGETIAIEHTNEGSGEVSTIYANQERNGGTPMPEARGVKYYREMK